MYLGFFYLLLSVIGFAGIGVVGESLCLQQADWRVLLLFRYAGAGTLLFIAGLIQRKEKKPLHICKCLWVGIICEGAQAFFFFSAIQQIGAGLAALMLYFYPLVALLFYNIPCPYIKINKESSSLQLLFLAPDLQLSKRMKVQTLLSVIGPLLVSVPLLVGADYSCMRGIAFAFATSICYGYYFSHGAAYLKEEPPLLCAGLSCLGALFVIVPMTLLFSDSNWYTIATENTGEMLLLILLTALPLLLLVKGMRLTGGIVAAILFSCEPMITAILAFFIHETTVPITALVGGIVSLLIVIVMEIEKRRTLAKKAVTEDLLSDQ